MSQRQASQTTAEPRASAHHAGASALALPAVESLQQSQDTVIQAQGAERSAAGAPAETPPPFTPPPNNTGMPDALKEGVEQLSGFSLNDVKVHYNSDKPAQLNAFAYAQGSDIHVASGQEKHLPHEAWHVVQQKQQRVQPTIAQGGTPINNDPALETEADTMGAKATQLKRATPISAGRYGAHSGAGTIQLYRGTAVIQANGLVTAMITGEETGDMSTDMIVKMVRSQVGVPSIDAIVRTALTAFDYQIGKPTVEGWISWAYSKLPTTFISNMLAWATPAYNAAMALHKVFKMLPEPVQNIILFALGKGMRKFLGCLERVLSAENADWIIDTIFVSDPSEAMALLTEWLNGLTSRPTSFLYEKLKSFVPIPGLSSGGSQSGGSTGTQTGGQEGGQTGTETVSDKLVQSKIDTLISINTSVLKMKLGKPKVQKGRAGGGSTPEAPGKAPGGLAVPFNFSVHLFGRDLDANDLNEVILPWNGGIFLSVPKAELKVGLKLADVFEVGSIMVTNLRVTDQGMQSMGLAVKNVKLANNAVSFDSIGGDWDKELGTALHAAGRINAMDHEFPVNITLNLDNQGKFDKAGLTISALDKFEIIKDVFTLEKPKFDGQVAKSGEVGIAFSGTPALKMGGVTLDAQELSVAYDHTATGKNSFEVSAESLNLRYGKLALQVMKPKFQSETKQLHTDAATLSYKKSNEPATEEAGWLSERGEKGEFSWLDMLNVTPEASFTIPYVDLMGSSPFVKMGKPKVADISLSMLGIEARLDFLKKSGSLKGVFSKETSVPLISLPIPILPGLEAYLDIDVGASVKATLAGELNKPDDKFPPWHVGGSAGVDASVWAKISAGLQAGSQLAVAIAAGLYAKGEGKFQGMLSLQGGIQFMNTSIHAVPDDPFKLMYKIEPSLIASAGIEIKAKALHVFQKTLYQREFKQWTLGKYTMEGDLTWNGSEWVASQPKGEFAGNRLNDPAYEDKPIENPRNILLNARTAIVNGAELRRELVKQVIEDYKVKDQEVYNELERYSIELAEKKGDKHRLKDEFLGSLRHYSDIKTLEAKIAELERIVNTLKTSYREVLLVLVNVDRVVSAIADNDLDLGTADLNTQLETIYRQDAKMEDIRNQKTQVKTELDKTNEKR